MLDVFCAPFCILHSSFCIPCVMVACPAFQGSGFEVRGSRFSFGFVASSRSPQMIFEHCPHLGRRCGSGMRKLASISLIRG
jgi:hypothetical protein